MLFLRKHRIFGAVFIKQTNLQTSKNGINSEIIKTTPTHRKNLKKGIKKCLISTT